MAFDWNLLGSILPSVVSVASGLGGVWLGGQLTWKRDEAKEKARTSKEAHYLAILVVAHLERFVDGCVSVAYDDGTFEGRPAGEDGQCHESTTTAPEFDPLELDVDWKALPADLMYDILNLPYKAEQLANRISGVWEYDDAPDYTETFWTRQYGYAVLGQEVSELARRLRKHAGLPIEVPAKGEWSRDDNLRSQRDKIAKKRADYEARIAKEPPLIPDEANSITSK